MAGAILCAGILGMAAYHLKPQAEVFVPPRPGEEGVTLNDAVRMLTAYPDIVKGMSREDVEDYIRDALQGVPNPYTGEPLAFEEGPGDVVVLEDEYGILFRTFTGHQAHGATAEPIEGRITGTPPEPPAEPKSTQLIIPARRR